MGLICIYSISLRFLHNLAPSHFKVMLIASGYFHLTDSWTRLSINRVPYFLYTLVRAQHILRNKNQSETSV